jgi:hypothetical protein
MACLGLVNASRFGRGTLSVRCRCSCRGVDLVHVLAVRDFVVESSCNLISLIRDMTCRLLIVFTALGITAAHVVFISVVGVELISTMDMGRRVRTSLIVAGRTDVAQEVPGHSSVFGLRVVVCLAAEEAY